MLRGTSEGLEFVFAHEPFDEALAALRRRLGERPEFYRGSTATATFHGTDPDTETLAQLATLALSFGIELRGVYGGAEAAEAAASAGSSYLGAPRRVSVATEFERRRAARSVVPLTEGARSLHADFAGARADLAARRNRRPVRSCVTPMAIPRDFFSPSRMPTSCTRHWPRAPSCRSNTKSTRPGISCAS